MTPKLSIKSVELTVEWYRLVLKEKKNYEKLLKNILKSF